MITKNDIIWRNKMARHVETWTRYIKKTEDYKEIPLDIREAYENYVGMKGFNPEIYMLHCPPDERAGVKLSEKLLYIYDNSLICIEKINGEITFKKFKAKEIKVMEIGFVLLDAWVSIAGKDGDKDEIITVYYNHVIYLFFEKLIEILRATALDLEYPPKYDDAVSSSIQSFSFMNYTHNVILEKESPVVYVLQPAITGKRLKLFKTTLTNEHMFLLTKSEVIQISEGRQKRRGQTDIYGHTKTFYIKKYINKPEYSIDEESKCLTLNLSSGPYSRNAIFDTDNSPNVIALISKF